MPSNPKERKIDIHKSTCDKAHLYATINIEAMEYALTTLKPTGFKMWSYIMKNQNGFRLSLHKDKMIKEDKFFTEATYKSGVAELIEKGFLVQIPGGREYDYNFYDNPPTFEEIKNTFETPNENSSKDIFIPSSIEQKIPSKSSSKVENISSYNIYNNTKDNNTKTASPVFENMKNTFEAAGTFNNPIPMSREWLLARRDLMNAAQSHSGRICIEGIFYTIEE